MTYERQTDKGYTEVMDVNTHEVVAKKIRLTAQKKCTLCNEKFAEGAKIEVLFPSSINFEEIPEEDGPWIPGNYTSKWLRNNAISIVELTKGITIHRAPYTKRFLGQANRAARTHALKSILRRFMGRTLY